VSSTPWQSQPLVSP